ARPELELEPLRDRDQQLAVELVDLGLAGRIVRRKDAHRVLGHRFPVVRLAGIVRELVLPRAHTGREPELAGPHVGDLALQVELRDVLLDLRERAGLRHDALDAVGRYLTGTRIRAVREDREPRRAGLRVVATRRERAPSPGSVRRPVTRNGP